MKSYKDELQEGIDSVINKNITTPNAIMAAASAIIIKKYLDKMSGAVKDYAYDELHDSEKYLDMYMQTHDKDYLQMSYDESTHAVKFMNEMPDSDKKKEYIAWHDKIVSKLKEYGFNAHNPY